MHRISHLIVWKQGYSTLVSMTPLGLSFGSQIVRYNENKQISSFVSPLSISLEKNNDCFFIYEKSETCHSVN